MEYLIKRRINGTDKEKIDLGITKLEDYMEIFSKFQNQYMEKNMSDNVVDIELELDEWRNIVEKMPYQKISILQIENEKFIDIDGIPKAKIVKTDKNKVFLFGETYEDRAGRYHSDIDEEIVIMVKDINESNNDKKFLNKHYFFEQFLKDIPPFKENIVKNIMDF